MATNHTIQSRYRNISITTFIILALTFVYYFFIYVKNKEHQFNEKAFRIIENVGNNIEKKYNNYSGIVENAMDHLIRYDYEDVKVVNPETLRNLFNNLSVPSELNIISFELDNSLKDNNKVIQKSKIRKLNEKTSFNGDSIYISLQTAAYTIKVGYKFDELLVNTLRRDFFKKYIIFSTTEVYFNDLPVEKFHGVKLDSIFKKEEGELSNPFHSTDRVELEFENKAQLMYVRPVNLSDTKTIYVAGIIEKQYYRQQAFSIGTNTSIILVFVFVLLILSLPFVKIYLIDQNERLKTRDVMAGFFVLMIGSGFVTLSLIGFFTQHGPSADEKNTFLKENAKVIEKNFKNELRNILSQITINEEILDSMQSVKYTEKQFRYDITLPKNKKEKLNQTYGYFSNLMWIDSLGHQLVKWQDKSTARVKLTFRDYFAIPNNKPGSLWIDNTISDSNAFFVDAIRSVTEGKTYAVVSRKSKMKHKLSFGENTFTGISEDDSVKPTVVAMVSHMQSLEDLTLPSNLSYMVINAEGEVLFHKNAIKILQENLEDEVDNLKLKLAIYTRTEATFNDFYDESEHRFYIRPIGKLPLFVITYSNEKIEKKIGAQIFSLSAILFLLLFGIIIIQLLLFLLVDHEFKRKTKGNNIFIRWLWPRPTKNRIYVLLSAYLIVSIFIYYIGGLYLNVLLSLSFFSLLVTVNLFVLRDFETWPEFWNKKSFFKMPIFFFSMLLFSLLIFINSDLANLDASTIFSSILFFLLSSFAIFLSFRIPDSSEKIDDRIPYNVWYFMFVTALSVFAIIGFYTKSYNFEKAIYNKNILLNLTQNIYKQGTSSKSNDYKDFKKLNSTFQFGSLPKGDSSGFPNETLLINTIRFNLSRDYETSSIPENNEKEETGYLKWKETPSSTGLTYTPENVFEKNKAFIISSEKAKLDINDFFSLNGKFSSYTKYLIFSLLFIFLVIYIAINFWTKKVFLLGIIPKLRSNVKKLAKEMPFIYIISPPQSGVITYFEKEYDNVFQIDLRFADLSKDYELNVPETVKVALIIDVDSINHDVLGKKVSIINRLKKLVDNEKHSLKKIILISIFSPREIMNAFDEDDKNEMQLVTNYLNIVGDFATAYFPLHYNDKNADDENLPVISQLLDESDEDSDCDEEDKILNVQAKAQLYYYATWNSMDRREQLLIYDLVTDGLVNFRNLYVIYHLMSRGILIYKDGTIDLFNKSFSNFVLTIVDKERSFNFDREAKQTGSWSNLKVPFLMIIGGVLAFIFLTQQSLFNDLFGWFTAAFALLPVLTKILSSFSMFSGKQKGS